MNESFIHQAFKEAEYGIDNKHGGAFGAIVVKDNKIVGWGHNQVPNLNDPTAHAEVMAIRDACRRLNTFDLSGCELYSTCEPCPMCLSAIMWARIPIVYFYLDRFDAEAMGFDDSLFYEAFNIPPQSSKIRNIGGVTLYMITFISPEIREYVKEVIGKYKNDDKRVKY